MSEKIKFDGDKAQYIAPTWDELDQLTLQLAKQIIDSGNAYQIIVALAKGAWPMSRSLIDYTQIKELDSLGVKFYKGINERFDKPEVYQQLSSSVKGKKVLIFDDVADSGESLIFTKQYLEEQGAAEVKTATLFTKPWSKFTPDYFGAETDSWIVFPFEKREMSELLAKNWHKQGIGKEEIAERLRKMNIGQEVLDL